MPGYTTALEDHIESTNSACTQLRQLSGEQQNQFAVANARLEGKKATCSVTDAGEQRKWPPRRLADHDDDDHTTECDQVATAKANGLHGQ